MFGSAEDDPSGSELAAVPLADLFLALGASFLFALFALQPTLRLQAAAAGTGPIERIAAGDLGIGGARPLVLLADGAGIREAGARKAGAGDAGPAVLAIPTSAIADAPALARRMRAAAKAGQPLLLAIFPGGEEAAFLFETAASAAGLPSFFQVRLDKDCRFLRTAPLAGLCRREMRAGRS